MPEKTARVCEFLLNLPRAIDKAAPQWYHFTVKAEVTASHREVKPNAVNTVP